MKLLLVSLLIYGTIQTYNWTQSEVIISKTIQRDGILREDIGSQGVVNESSHTLYPRGEEDTRRERRINEYLKEYGSPLAGRGGEIIDIADTYGVCPYLITAISVIESGAGRDGFCNNLFGFGKYCYNDAIDGFRAVAEALAGEGTNGHYYSKCYKGDSRTRLEVEECLLGTYNTENPNYTKSVLKQRDYIQSYKY